VNKVELIKLVVGPLRTNTYLLNLQETHSILIDAGPGSFDRVIYYLDRYNVKLKYVLLTHAHFDHISDVQFIKEVTGAKVIMHHKDLELIEFAERISQTFRIRWKLPDIDIVLTNEKVLSIGDITINIIHTPGHTPGSICYYIEDIKWIFTGDTIFKGTIGRVDLPGGSYKDICYSIKRITSLPGYTRIYPGHGPSTTIEEEKRENPYVRAILVERYRHLIM